MADPATGSVASAVVATTGTAAGLLALLPAGLSPSLLIAGGASFFGGCCAWTDLLILKKLNSDDAVTIVFGARQAAMLLCCVPLAAVASCIVFLAASVSKADVAADAAILCGFLLITGLRGPEGFQWIADTFANIFSKFIPGQKPGGN